VASDRITLLEELVAADPADLLGHLMLGNEYLSADRHREAIASLARYCEAFDGDKGAACLSLARAREAVGDVVGARDALRLGLVSAAAFRHRALLETLETEMLRLAEAPPA
jgi:predicted Zn-dependent protease